MERPEEFPAAFARAQELMEEFQVPVIVEAILERVTNTSMGSELDNMTELEGLAESPADAPTAILALQD